jgi:ADP-heptose:LPS heptosyltransferase
MKDVLNEEEMIPKLERWFELGPISSVNNAYSNKYDNSHNNYDNVIAFWPFAQYGQMSKRSPSKEWCSKLTEQLISLGYVVHHFGYINEPELSASVSYKRFVDLSYFEQIKASLSSKLAIGTDSGSMWCLGAYSHPAVHIMTYWLPGHYQNPFSLVPANINSKNFFNDECCENIAIKDILDYVLETVKL